MPRHAQDTCHNRLSYFQFSGLDLLLSQPYLPKHLSFLFHQLSQSCPAAEGRAMTAISLFSALRAACFKSVSYATLDYQVAITSVDVLDILVTMKQ